MLNYRDLDLYLVKAVKRSFYCLPRGRNYPIMSVTDTENLIRFYNNNRDINWKPERVIIRYYEKGYVDFGFSQPFGQKFSNQPETKNKQCFVSLSIFPNILKKVKKNLTEALL